MITTTLVKTPNDWEGGAYVVEYRQLEANETGKTAAYIDAENYSQH